MMNTTQLVVVVVLIVLSAIFSGTETAFTSLSMIQKKDLEKRKGKSAKVAAHLAGSPDILLTTILIGNNIVNLSASSLTTQMAMAVFGNEAVGIATGLLTIIILIFGEITPKQIAINYNMSIALVMAIPVRILTIVLFPVVWVFKLISNLITRIFSRGGGEKMSKEGIMHVLDVAEDEGLVEQYETDLVEKVFNFGDTLTRAIMTHQSDVFMLHDSQTIDESYEEIVKSRFSRIPVYGEKRDDITGVVLLRDLLKAKLDGKGGATLKSVARKPVFVPDLVHVDDLYRKFQSQRLQMAIVLDEYGSFAGVVTMEDVAEELFGEMYDEHEIGVRQRVRLVPGTDDEYIVQADTPFWEFLSFIEAEHESSEKFDTVASYLMYLSEKILNLDDVVESPLGTFTITRMKGMRMLEVRFKKAEQEEEEE